MLGRGPGGTPGDTAPGVWGQGQRPRPAGLGPGPSGRDFRLPQQGYPRGVGAGSGRGERSWAAPFRKPAQSDVRVRERPPRGTRLEAVRGLGGSGKGRLAAAFGNLRWRRGRPALRSRARSGQRHVTPDARGAAQRCSRPRCPLCGDDAVQRRGRVEPGLGGVSVKAPEALGQLRGLCTARPVEGPVCPRECHKDS